MPTVETIYKEKWIKYGNSGSTRESVEFYAIYFISPSVSFITWKPGSGKRKMKNISEMYDVLYICMLCYINFLFFCKRENWGSEKLRNSPPGHILDNC
jgi:hypothetical protein